MFDEMIAVLEAKRKSIFPWMIVFFVLLGAGIIMMFIFPILFLLVMIACLVLGLAVIAPKRKEYRELYKQTLVRKVFAEQMQNLNYQPKSGLSKKYIEYTGFMLLGNIYKSEDLISGTYKNVNFSRADVVIQDESGSGENSSTTTYFKGRWIILDFNKSFSRDMQLIQKGFGYSKTKKSIFTRKEERRHKVEFENEAFNGQFTCYCENDQEAFYVVTPQIMDKLLQFASISDGKIMLGFKDSQVHLAICNYKDSLEPSVFKRVSYENDVKPVYFETQIITSFIDILSLDRNIYKN